MGDISATRDLVIIGIIAYIAYKLKDPLADAKQAASDAAKQAQETFNFYLSGGELQVAADAAQQGQTDTGLTQDVVDEWTRMMREAMGKAAPEVPTPPTAADAGTGEGMQETVQILPHTPAAETPELTPDIIEMIEAPAPDRPLVQIFPGTEEKKQMSWEELQEHLRKKNYIPPEQRATPAPKEYIMPIIQQPPRQPTYRTIQPIVPPVTELVRQPTPTRQPITETRPLDSMSSKQAETEGWKYSGVVGWYK